MPDGDLTDKQIQFLEKFCAINILFYRQASIEQRQATTDKFRKFNTEAALVRKQIETLANKDVARLLSLRLKEAERAITESEGEVDLPKAMATLNDLKGVAEQAALEIEAKAKIAIIAPKVPGVLASNPANRNEIGAMWEVISERFDSGVKAGSTANLKSALELMVKLDKLLLAAKPGGDTEGLTGSVASGKEALAEDSARQQGRETMKAEQKRYDLAESRCQATFEANWPPALASARDAARDALVIADDDTSEEIGRKVSAATAPVTDFVSKADTFLNDLTAWETARDAASLALVSLKGHKFNTAVPYVAPEIAKLDTVMSEAGVKATAFNYPGARTDVLTVPDSCAALVKVADDVAKLAAVRTVRETLVGTLVLPAGTDDIPSGVFDKVQKSVDDVKKMLADGQQAADSGRLAEAVALFDKIPAAAEHARIMIRHQKEYDDDYAALKERCDALASKSGEVGKAIKTNVDLCKRQLRAALKQGEDNIDKAIQSLGGLWTLVNALDARVEDVETWIAEKKHFDDRLKIVEDRKDANGRVAIDDFYQRMLADKSRSEGLVADAAAIKEWAMATKIVTATKSMHDEKIALAEVAKDYLARKKALDEKIQDLESKADSGVSALPIAGAKTLVSNAVAQTVAKDWKGAVETLEAAKQQTDKIETIIASAEQVTGARNDPGLANIAADFGPAYAAYERAAQAAAAQDSDNKFQSIRTGAANKAGEARTAASASAPNPGLAATKLGEAIDECTRVVRLVGERYTFNVLANIVNDAVHTTLPPRNIDDVIKAELDQAENLLDTALNQISEPIWDYGSGIASMAQAQELVTKATRKVDAFDAIKDHREKIDKRLTKMDVAAYQTDLALELLRLKTLKQEIEDTLASGDTAKAMAKAKEGATLADSYKQFVKDYDKAKKWRQESLDDIARIKGLGTQAERELYVKDDIKKMEDLDVEMGQQMTAKVFLSVQKVSVTSYRIGLAATKVMTDGPLYETVRVASETELTKLTARRPINNPFAAEMVDKMETRYKAAVEQAGLRNFTGAKKRLDSFVTDCGPVEEVLVKLDAYRKSRKDADVALADVAKVNDLESIEPLVTRLRGQHAAGVVLGDAGKFEDAETEFKAVIQGCVDALTASQEHQAFTQLVENVRAAPSGDAEAMRKQIADGRNLIAGQKGQVASLFVRAEIFGATEELNAAEKLVETDPKTAGEHITEAMRVCALARLAMGLYTQMTAAETKARKDITDFMGQAEADFVRDDLTGLLGRLETTMNNVRVDPSPASRDKTQSEIEAVLADFLRLKLAAERQLKHVILRGAINTKLADMERHDQRYAMKDDIALIRQLVKTADGQAEKHDHDGAAEQLKKAQEIQDSAVIKADMSGDKEPAVADIKKILAREDGSKQLDAIVATLDDVAKKKVLRVAFEARFECKLEINKKFVNQPKIAEWKLANPEPDKNTDPDAHSQYVKDLEAETTKQTKYQVANDKGRRGPNIQRFYEAMTVLPDSDTLDNDMMLEFESTEGPAEGSFYNSGTKRVTMREGEFGDSGIYGVGLKHELEDVDPDSVPVEAEAITYFSWNTLHEVGHAVDAKLNFMTSKGNAMVGWVEYGGNTYPIAQAIAGKFNYDAAYISAYMLDATPPIPEPDGCDAEEWERRRVLSCAWVDRVRVGNDPWQTSASAKDCDIGGTCYQESYAGSWTSYPMAQRKKGVSGYQFRSPLEWFSEVYAAYHTGKLNPNHPAQEWLKTL